MLNKTLFYVILVTFNYNKLNIILKGVPADAHILRIPGFFYFWVGSTVSMFFLFYNIPICHRKAVFGVHRHGEIYS